jgi:hypothetical protein
MCVPLPHEQDTNSADTAYGIACLTILDFCAQRRGTLRRRSPAPATLCTEVEEAAPNEARESDVTAIIGVSRLAPTGILIPDHALSDAG